MLASESLPWMVCLAVANPCEEQGRGGEALQQVVGSPADAVKRKGKLADCGHCAPKDQEKEIAIGKGI